MKTYNILTVVTLMFFANIGQAKVYKYVEVGRYNSSIDMALHNGQPFLKFMTDTVYPEIEEQAANRSSGSHIKGIEMGEGVEIRLTEDVTTFHVKYKADWEEEVERSGRSFSAVGKGRKIRYVADASYKHYLTTLEPLVRGDEEEVARFYKAILMVITDTDPTGFEDLSWELNKWPLTLWPFMWPSSTDD